MSTLGFCLWFADWPCIGCLGSCSHCPSNLRGRSRRNSRSRSSGSREEAKAARSKPCKPNDAKVRDVYCCLTLLACFIFVADARREGQSSVDVEGQSSVDVEGGLEAAASCVSTPRSPSSESDSSPYQHVAPRRAGRGYCLGK